MPPRRGRKSDERSTGSFEQDELSVEETNKLRASLGLAPLKVGDDSTKPQKVSSKDAPAEEMARAEKNAAEELKLRVIEAKRAREEKVGAPATLGDAGDDLDEDLMNWVEKNRGKKSAPKRRKVDVDAPVEDDEDVLKQAKIKGHSLDALDQNEEMVLTLADRSILDESGNDLVDEEELLLENVRERENKEMQKAIKASQKAKPLWEEEGAKKSLLDKYDEEEEEAFVLGDVAKEKLTKQNFDERDEGSAGGDMKTKLLAAQATLLAPLKAIGGDYYTTDELNKMKKPKKKKQRKLKKKALTQDDLDELEQLAAMENGGEGHLATREDREERRKIREEKDMADVQEKRSKFNMALEKANMASTNLRNNNPGLDMDEDDDELSAALAKARDVALKKQQNIHAKSSLEDVAKQAITRREKQELEARNKPRDNDLTFTDIGEFARSVGMNKQSNIKEEEQDNDNDVKWDDMVVDGGSDAIKQEEEETVPARKRKYRRHGQADDMEVEPILKQEENSSEDEKKDFTGVGNDSKIGLGLGSMLSYLKERGELHKPVEWAGRVNDSKDPFFTKAMGGYEDVYSGGRSEDDIAATVEVALTRKDEYGRILTPKEAFRQLCHNFHGIQPSQSSKEKRMRQAARELAQKKAATASIEGGVVGNLKNVQETKATPYMVLSGTVKPGQTRDAAKGKK